MPNKLADRPNEQDRSVGYFNPATNNWSCNAADPVLTKQAVRYVYEKSSRE